MYTIDHKQQPGLTARLANICMLLAITIFSTASNAAEADNTEKSAYVDSVHSWGAWALGIEPAAGPRAPQNNPMNDRSASLKFRPNDNAAYSTIAIPVNTVTSVPSTPIPPAPVVPTVVPTGPPGLVPTTGPVPVGGPFFPGS